MKIRTLLFGMAAAGGVTAASMPVAHASFPVGVWVKVSKITYEPDQANATAVRVEGAFMIYGGSGYSTPAKGSVYYACPAGQEKVCQMEWADLAANASQPMDTCKGFGAQDKPTGTFYPEGSSPGAPDTYPIAMGVVGGFSFCQTILKYLEDGAGGAGGSAGAGGDAGSGGASAGAGGASAGSGGASAGSGGSSAGAGGAAGGSGGGAGSGGASAGSGGASAGSAGVAGASAGSSGAAGAAGTAGAAGSTGGSAGKGGGSAGKGGSGTGAGGAGAGGSSSGLGGKPGLGTGAGGSGTAGSDAAAGADAADAEDDGGCSCSAVGDRPSVLAGLPLLGLAIAWAARRRRARLSPRRRPRCRWSSPPRWRPRVRGCFATRGATRCPRSSPSCTARRCWRARACSATRG